jgi:hypothetical protein
MRSSSRNNRALTVLGVAAASLLLGSAAYGSEQAHNFVLTAYSNGPGGQELVSGNYSAAEQALHHRNSLSTFDTATNSNNRCVALAVTKQWDAARTACNTAVRDAERQRATLPAYNYWSRKREDAYVAIALANRAVVHSMLADNAAAAADLKKAGTLSPTADFVTRNQFALAFPHAEVARLDVAAKSP